MAAGDYTVMGGGDGQFHTTQWTQILGAHATDGNVRNAALGGVMERYWKPVYCYLRRKGYNNEKAKDLTQDFFTEIVMGRQLVQKADPAIGKFRSYLLRALNNYVTSQWRKETASKRSPERGLVSLEGLDNPNLPGPDPALSPDAAFTHAWAARILDEVLGKVQQDCLRSNQRKHWQVFSARVVRPTLAGEEPPPLDKLCATLGLQSPEQASAMLATAKRKFRSALRRHVRQFVSSDDQVDSEITELMNILSAGG